MPRSISSGSMWTARGTFYLRVTIMNPFTDKESLENLIAKIKEIAEGQEPKGKNLCG